MEKELDPRFKEIFKIIGVKDQRGDELFRKTVNYHRRLMRALEKESETNDGITAEDVKLVSYKTLKYALKNYAETKHEEMFVCFICGAFFEHDRMEINAFFAVQSMKADAQKMLEELSGGGRLADMVNMATDPVSFKRAD